MTGWLPHALVIAACWASGGLLLPGPHTPQNVPFWPPVGITLAALLVGGPRLGLSVFIGHWGLGYAIQAGHTASPVHALLNGLLFAVASTVQSFVGFWLVRRFCWWPLELVRSREIAAFVVIAGPGHCAVAATLKMLFDGFRTPNYDEVWLWQWVTDTLGGLIVTPIILTLALSPRSIWAARRRAVGLPLALLAVVTVALHATGRELDAAAQLRNMGRSADTLKAALTAEGQRLTTLLETYRIWLGSGQDAAKGDEDFVRRRIQEFRTLFPAADDLFVVSEDAAPPEYRDAIRNASQTGDPSAGALSGSRSEQLIVVIRTHPQDQIRYLGCRIDTRRLIDATQAITNARLTGRLVDVADTRFATLPQPHVRITRPLAFANRTWQVVIYADADYPHTSRSDATATAHTLAVLAAGFLVTVLLLLTGRTAIVQAEVARRTQELSRSQAERAAVEAALQEARREAALGRLAGGVAHEFNNLFTVALGDAGRVRERLTADDPAQSELLRIEQTIVQAAEICQQMLASTGKGTIIRQPLELNEFIPSVIADVRPRLPHAPDIRLTLAARSVPALVDAVQFRRLLANLLTNAAEAYTQPGQPIRVSYGQLQDGAEPFVWVEVADVGSGMTPDVMERMYEPFFSTRFVGRGLGLSAVRGIAQSHGGRVTITSEPNAGTTVRVTLESRVTADQMLTPPPSRYPTVAVGRPAPEPISNGGVALVVDDDATVRELAAVTLRSTGWTVLTAENGEVALQLVQRHADRLRLVVLDLLMPVMDGHTTLAQLRLSHRMLPIVVMSAYSDFDLSSEFGSGTPLAFLRKPFRPPELLECVAELLNPART